MKLDGVTDAEQQVTGELADRGTDEPLGRVAAGLSVLGSAVPGQAGGARGHRSRRLPVCLAFL